MQQDYGPLADGSVQESTMTRRSSTGISKDDASSGNGDSVAAANNEDAVKNGDTVSNANNGYDVDDEKNGDNDGGGDVRDPKSVPLL